VSGGLSGLFQLILDFSSKRRDLIQYMALIIFKSIAQIQEKVVSRLCGSLVMSRYQTGETLHGTYEQCRAATPIVGGRLNAARTPRPGWSPT
jgi:hypothetical protein